ncbi:MAG: ribonuclease Z [Clostridiaceae bacterium]
MVDLCLLGCGGGMPMPNRYLSSLLINYQGKKILIDCGEGTQVSMKMVGWGFKTIDIICITHIHGDHIVGLPGLLATIGNSMRTEPITIIGPKGITEAISGLRVIVPYLPYHINIIEVDENYNEVFEFGEVTISFLQLEHSSPCIGYGFYINRKPKFNIEKAMRLNIPKIFWNRLQKGEEIKDNNIVYTPEMVLGEERKGIKLSYITDTRPIDEIISFVRESDLFICEGTYGDEEKLDKAIQNKHMTFSEAATLALKSKVEELLLTHFSPVMEEPNLYKMNAENIFENTIIGYDRLFKTLQFKD